MLARKGQRAMEHQHEVLMLTHLGLTSNQARVYLTLFLSGLSTAKTISKKSGVARSDVYRVIVTLEKIGLVERVISAPCKFRAISIQDAVSVLMERRMNETSELQAIAGELLKKLKKHDTRMALEEDETKFNLIPEQVNIRWKKKTLENVQVSYDAVTSWRDPHGVMFIGIEEITEALQRGVEIRVIVDEPSEEKILLNIMKHLKKFPTFKTRHLLNPPKALVSVYDKKEAWVCTCTKPGLKECPTLWTDNPCLLSILQDYFDILWLTAVER